VTGGGGGGAVTDGAPIGFPLLTATGGMPSATTLPCTAEGCDPGDCDGGRAPSAGLCPALFGSAVEPCGLTGSRPGDGDARPGAHLNAEVS